MKLDEYILKNMPPNLTPLEKARYIYLQLGMILNFSTKYQNTSTIEMIHMLTEGISITEPKYNQVICSAWSKIYSDLLNKVGIENTILNETHMYVIFKIDNKIWLADATYGATMDLANIRYGRETIYFGPSSAKSLDEERAHVVMDYDSYNAINEMDKKFPFYQERKENYNNLILTLQDISKMAIPTKEKLERVFDMAGVMSSGYLESQSHIKILERYALTKEEFTKVKGNNLKRTNKNGEVDIVQCISLEENGNYYYYLLAPNLHIRRVEAKDLIKLALMGYGIEDKSIPGIIYPKNFVRGKVSKKSLKYKLYKKMVGDLIEYDEEQYKPLKVA